MPRATGLGDDARRILALAWPLLAGQLAVLAFGTVDTVLLGRHAPGDLAALAIGSAAYVSVFVGLMGVVMAVGPVAARAFGAGRKIDAGHELRQGLWLALGLAVLGWLLLRFPWPFLALARPAPAVDAQVRDYLGALAWALPASLLFAAFRAFHSAVSRPRVVMLIQMVGLAAKVPLTIVLALGIEGPGGPAAPLLPAYGVAGCGWATAIVMWLQVVVSWALLRRDSFYRDFGLRRALPGRPDRAALARLLRLGIPMGASIMVEVTGFTFMALFIARLGADPVAGHQIAANLTGLLFMMPLALGNAASALVGQRLGAGDHQGARRLGWHAVQIGGALALAAAAVLLVARGTIVDLYTEAPAVAAIAAPLLGWVAAFHLVDALQGVAAAVLRAHHVVTRPFLVYAACAWGVGIGGGCLVGLDLLGRTPPALVGPSGFWFAGAVGLALAALALLAMLAFVTHRQPAAAG